MAQQISGNYDALAWVQNEVQQSLADALQILTRFIDDPSDNAVMEPCVTQLHQVNGIMEMLSMQGALTLSQEMLACATAIRGKDGDTVDIQDSLLKGLLLLPNYLKQISPEIQDHPLRLLSTINELRASRNEAAIESESLFKPNLSIALPASILPQPNDKRTLSSIDKISRAYQISLVSWIKNNDDTSFNKLAELVHYLRTHTVQERNILLWWIAEGVIEAIADNGLEVTAKVKLSLGKLNEPLKILSKNDEQYLISVFPAELVQQLLLLVAQATSNGEQVTAIKAVFGLNYYDQAIHQKIYSFTDDALVEARAGILEQLLELKEEINQFDGNNELARSEIETLDGLFISLTNSLSLITEETAAKTLQHHHQAINAKLAEDKLPSDVQLMALADDLIRIENQLKQANQISTSHQQHDENLHMHSVVIDECLNELANIKEKLIQVEHGQTHSSTALPEIAEQLSLIAGSTSMLKLDAVTALLNDSASTLIQHDQEATLEQSELGQFAEVVAATELYLEGLSQHGQHQTQLIEQAQTRLQQFAQPESIISPTEPELTDADETFDETDDITVPADIDDDIIVSEEALSPEPSPTVETSVDRYIQQLEAAPAPKQETSVDRYIQQLESAPTPKQETSVDRYIQQLESAPAPKQETSVDRYIQQLETAPVPKQETSVDRYIQQLESAPAPKQETSVDRYIQQLEAAQTPKQETSVERYIQQLESAPAPKQETSVDRYIQQLESAPAPKQETSVDRYIQQLESTPAPKQETSVDRYIEQLATTENVIPEVEVDIEAEQVEETTAQFAEGIDPEIAAIFLEEADDILAEFDSLIPDWQATKDDQTLSVIRRHFHTLKGSGRMAGAQDVGELAWSVEDALNKVLDGTLGQSEDVETIVSGSHLLIPALLTRFTQGETTNDERADTLREMASRLLTPVQAQDDNFSVTEDDEVPQNEGLLGSDSLSTLIADTDELWEQYQLLRQQLTLLPDDADYPQAIERTLAKLSETAQKADATELAQSYQLLSRLYVDTTITDNACSSLIELGEKHANQLLINVVENKQDDVDLADYQQQIDDYLNSLAEQTAEVTIPEADPELLEAFTEEYAELLESSGNAIKQWQQDPEQTEAAMQLHRDLHTLKGGARLIAISSIADLTHNMESLALAATEGECPTNDDFFSLLQRCQDRLAEMQEQLNQQVDIPAADNLIADINKLINPEDKTEIEVAQLIATPDAVDPDPVPEQEQKAPSQQASSSANEQVRVKAELLDFLTNFAGEVNISRDRVSQQNTAMRQQLSEMESTVERLQEQLRNFEIETEAQILFRYEDNASKATSDFDPLELDRFSQMHQLSRSLTESVTDLHDITRSLEDMVRESDTILLQQSRLSTDLQQGLMNTRLLPFSGLVPRFERIVRQTNEQLGKQAEFIVYGADRELDRTLLDHIVAPIEHILRNAIIHGIEEQQDRVKAGKDPVAQLSLSITRDGSEILITLSDDGRGIDVEKIRQKALEKELINPDKMPSDDELIQLILHSGFSTADDVSQLAGRGVGMDVVNSEIRNLKGRLSIQSVAGQGTSFNIRLPLTLSVMQALLVSCAEQHYALPLASVHAGERISIKNVKTLLGQGDEARYEFNGTYYNFMSLATLLNQPFKLPEQESAQLPLLLFSSGDMHVALVVDAINSSREIVLKSVGEQLGHIDAITGATILGDGQIVFVLDIPTLVNSVETTAVDNLLNTAISTLEQQQSRLPLAMVVDDSITMRKASGNLLKRHGFDVITARDGIDAVAQLNDQQPDVILLDVEMPRMDGFEFATLVRNDEQHSHIPIIMVTSRTGDKHRNRARSIGVNAYLGKPYQEGEIVDTLQNLLGTKYPEHA